ncbi:MAG: hypothetical protein CMB44_00935 [Euryarchaeota archaeon]|nr:hypothetical protein [Euryarchaeota archaeon]
MAGVREYSDIDRSWTTFSLVGIVLTLSLVLIYTGNDFSANSISSISSSEKFSTLGIAVFRAIISLVCFSTIATIILDPRGMTYNLLDYETKLYGPKRITGTTRMSAFTMWSFTLMGTYFAVSSYSSWSVHFGWELGEWAVWLVPALFSTVIASAFLVTVTVTYMLIPEANERGDNIDHYFKWDSQLMHNGNVIFILTEMAVSDISLSLWYAPYPVIFGCIYVLFSAFNARRSGIYFYDFIDPRLNGSHIIHMVLLGVMLIHFILAFTIQGLAELSFTGHVLTLIVIGFLATTFSNHSEK